MSGYVYFLHRDANSAWIEPKYSCVLLVVQFGIAHCINLASQVQVKAATSVLYSQYNIVLLRNVLLCSETLAYYLQGPVQNQFIHLGYNEEVKQMVWAAGLVTKLLVWNRSSTNFKNGTGTATHHKGADVHDKITVSFSH